MLLIAFHFPPDPAVGGVRPARLLRELTRAGHTVEVVTAALRGETAGRRDGGTGYAVFSVEPWPSPRVLLSSLRRRLRPLETADPLSLDQPAAEQGSRPKVGAIRRLVVSLLWTPDDAQGFIIPASRAAVQRARAVRPDVIYSTAPPFSTHLAARRAARRLGIKWAAEFRDPWPLSRAPDGIAASPLATRVNTRLRAKALNDADLLVAVTPALGTDLLAGVSDRDPNRLTVALNGIDEAFLGLSGPSPHPATGPISILHAGTIYHGRNPEPFLEALATLRAAGALPERGICVTFLGDGRCYQGSPVAELARRHGVDDLIVFEDEVTAVACRERLVRADVLLLFAQRQPAQIPNKLYDYLGARRPVLALLDQGGESARLLMQAGSHFLAYSDNPADIARRIREAIEASSRGWAPEAGTLDALGAAHQMGMVVRGLERLAGNHPG